MQQDIHKQLIEKIRTYRIPQAALELLGQHKPLIISGTTAAGKDTVAEYIEANSNWRRIVTHTTRAPRAGEVNGKNYCFVDDAEMYKLLNANEMIEAKFVHGHTIYGSSIAAYQTIIDKGSKPIMRIDIQGIEEILKDIPNISPIFILPPSFEVWMNRLDKRGAMSHTEKERRLQSARIEMGKALKNQKFKLVVNRDVDECAREVLNNIIDPVTQNRNRELAKTLIEETKHF